MGLKLTPAGQQFTSVVDAGLNRDEVGHDIQPILFLHVLDVRTVILSSECEPLVPGQLQGLIGIVLAC
jgi:hypothetical protein